MKGRIIFRRHPFNTLTIPLLLQIVERSNLATIREIRVWDTPNRVEPGDIVLFSLMTPFLPLVEEEMGQYRQMGAQVLVGGPHVDRHNHELLLEMGASAATSAPAEAVLVEMIEACIDGTIDSTPFWESGSGREPPWSDFIPVSPNLPTLPPLELMRGCGYRCAFCATSGRRREHRDWVSTQSYIKELNRRRASRINFIVPSALEHRHSPGQDPLEALGQLFEFARMEGMKQIEYGIFPSEIRPETVTPQAIALLSQWVSHRSLTIGYQSGAEERLREMGRSKGAEAVHRAIETLNAYGFQANIDLIVGFPGEGYDEFQSTLHRALDLGPPHLVKLQIHRFFPLGNSPWQWRLPSPLCERKTAQLRELLQKGGSRGGWELNERQWQAYWSWLTHKHDKWASRYHSPPFFSPSAPQL